MSRRPQAESNAKAIVWIADLRQEQPLHRRRSRRDAARRLRGDAPLDQAQRQARRARLARPPADQERDLRRRARGDRGLPGREPARRHRESIPPLGSAGRLYGAIRLLRRPHRHRRERHGCQAAPVRQAAGEHDRAAQLRRGAERRDREEARGVHSGSDRARARRLGSRQASPRVRTRSHSRSRSPAWPRRAPSERPRSSAPSRSPGSRARRRSVFTRSRGSSRSSGSLRASRRART